MLNHGAKTVSYCLECVDTIIRACEGVNLHVLSPGIKIRAVDDVNPRYMNWVQYAHKVSAVDISDSRALNRRPKILM